MARVSLIAAALIALVAGVPLSTVAAPASASYGAVAYDQDSGKYGAAWNQPTQAEAFQSALQQCASPQCRVHPVEPKGCGALALSDKGKEGHTYWGGADRETLDAAKHDAVAHCQTHTNGGGCTVRISGCNQ
jgi:uncharacterized protein DUF4189